MHISELRCRCWLSIPGIAFLVTVESLHFYHSAECFRVVLDCRCGCDVWVETVRNSCRRSIVATCLWCTWSANARHCLVSRWSWFACHQQLAVSMLSVGTVGYSYIIFVDGMLCFCLCPSISYFVHCSFVYDIILNFYEQI